MNHTQQPTIPPATTLSGWLTHFLEPRDGGQAGGWAGSIDENLGARLPTLRTINENF